jgi:hypothetical protein
MQIESISPKPISLRNGNSDAEILEEARKRASEANIAWQETFDNAEDDELFISGVQWDVASLRDRENEGRPSLVINQLQQYVSRVAGAQKKQVQEIKISPTESSSKEPTIKTVGGNDLQVSKVLEGVVRNIQSISNAPAQYKTAFRHSLGGIGWLRVLTEYSRNDSFDLDIKIEAAQNRWSILVDPHANESDYCDMNYAFIFERMVRKEFKKRYPKGIAGELGRDSSTELFWGDERTITVAEYFRREPIKRTLILLSSGETVYEDEVQDVLDELLAQGITVVRKRTIDTYKIVWSKITANSILEKEREFPTTTIPIVPVLGREVNIRGKRKYQGLITQAKDPQRMLNYWQSAATERISLAPKAPYIAEAGATQGRIEWNTANTKNWSILTYNKGFQPPKREAPPSMPVAEMNMAQNMQQSIQSSIGIYDASIGKAGNETSGRAILARQSEADSGTFEFTDNLANAMRRIGILLVEMIPKVYDTERILRIKNQDGSGDFVEINKVIKDEQTGKEVVINDLALGKYDVTVTTGSSYATKRIETADSMLQFMQAVPQAAQVAADLVAENMDFNNSEAIAGRLKKMLPPNLLSPEEQEEIAKNTPKQEAPPPSPEQIKAQADMEMKQLDMQMKQSEMEFQLRMEEIKLQTAELNLRAKEVEKGSKIREENEILDEERREATKERMAKEIAEKMRGQAMPEAQEPQMEEMGE